MPKNIFFVILHNFLFLFCKSKLRYQNGLKLSFQKNFLPKEFSNVEVTKDLKFSKRIIIWSDNFVMKTKFGEFFKIYKFDIHEKLSLQSIFLCKHFKSFVTSKLENSFGRHTLVVPQNIINICHSLFSQNQITFISST